MSQYANPEPSVPKSIATIAFYSDIFLYIIFCSTNFLYLTPPPTPPPHPTPIVNHDERAVLVWWGCSACVRIIIIIINQRRGHHPPTRCRTVWPRVEGWMRTVCVASCNARWVGEARGPWYPFWWHTPRSIPSEESACVQDGIWVQSSPKPDFIFEYSLQLAFAKVFHWLLRAVSCGGDAHLGGSLIAILCERIFFSFLEHIIAHVRNISLALFISDVLNSVHCRHNKPSRFTNMFSDHGPFVKQFYFRWVELKRL